MACLSQSLDGMSEPSWSWQVLQEGRYKGAEELSAVFKDVGVDLKKPIIASCGTGVTASVLALALHQIAPAARSKPPTCIPEACRMVADMYTAQGLRNLPAIVDEGLHMKQL